MKNGKVIMAGKTNKTVQPTRSVRLRLVEIAQTESENKRKSRKFKSNRKVKNLANENFEKSAPKFPDDTKGTVFESGF